MARIRTIKPEFFTSLTVAGLPVEARLTFVGLWTHVDDEGRCVDDARLVKAAVWPLDDRLSADVEQDLRALSESSLILRYKVGGRSYLAVRSWCEHQRINRPTKSKLPPPPPTAESGESGEVPAPPPAETLVPPAKTPPIGEPSSNTHTQLTEDSLAERKGKEQGTGKGKEGEAPQAAPPRKRGTRLPNDFAVTDDMKTWFRQHCPGVDGARETLKFRNYWQAKSGKDATKLDWTKTWQNWMIRAADDLAGRRPSSVATGANRHTDQRPDQNPFRTGEAVATYASQTIRGDQ